MDSAMGGDLPMLTTGSGFSFSFSIRLLLARQSQQFSSLSHEDGIRFYQSVIISKRYWVACRRMNIQQFLQTSKRKPPINSRSRT